MNLEQEVLKYVTTFRFQGKTKGQLVALLVEYMREFDDAKLKSYLFEGGWRERLLASIVCAINCTTEYYPYFTQEIESNHGGKHLKGYILAVILLGKKSVTSEFISKCLRLENIHSENSKWLIAAQKTIKSEASPMPEDQSYEKMKAAIGTIIEVNKIMKARCEYYSYVPS